MTVVQTLLTTQIMNNAPESFPVGHWDGYNIAITPIEFNDGLFQGYYLTWGGFQETTVSGMFQNAKYSGYTTNFAGFTENTTVNLFQNGQYSGYTTNFAGAPVNTIPDFTNVDMDSVIDHPKDQRIYYKVKGFNPITQLYESWIIIENITGRPELFDPGRFPPTIERDIQKGGATGISPTGNALVHITIVARWIQ